MLFTNKIEWLGSKREFEIAVATSSVNSPMRSTASAGIGSACRETAIIAPS
ncbi:MAG TPA: hypothetical protein VHJ54_06955 [Solirubrobacterales bacterium]|nr:hypothetical protein [Solirubrobacterales bacterium]